MAKTFYVESCIYGEFQSWAFYEEKLIENGTLAQKSLNMHTILPDEFDL